MREEQRVIILRVLTDIERLHAALELFLLGTTVAGLHIEVTGLILVEQLAQLLVVVPMRRHHNVFLSNVRRRMLVRLVVAERHRHLVHVK
jgi:hypothetical protein